jgi:hypothetical protein
MERPCDRIVRAALQRGEIKRVTRFKNLHGWQFGRRHFNDETIQRAIAAGHAVRVGDVVRAAA